MADWYLASISVASIPPRISTWRFHCEDKQNLPTTFAQQQFLQPRYKYSVNILTWSNQWTYLSFQKDSAETNLKHYPLINNSQQDFSNRIREHLKTYLHTISRFTCMYAVPVHQQNFRFWVSSIFSTTVSARNTFFVSKRKPTTWIEQKTQ